MDMMEEDVTRIGEKRTEVWWGNLNEDHKLEVLGRQGSIILKWVLKKYHSRE
jgi:hypothetical protein